MAHKWHSFWHFLTSSNINRFSKLFHCQNRQKICSDTITKGPTTSKVTVTFCRSSAGILHGCLQKDGAPSHTARNTSTYLLRENVTFIEPHMWLPNSQDLNPVDCAVWGALQLGFAISVHFFKSGFSDIFHAKSGYPDFIRIFLCRSI